MKAPNGCPCYDCKERQIGCHGNCPKYIEWAQLNQEANERRKKAEQLERWRKSK